MKVIVLLLASLALVILTCLGIGVQSHVFQAATAAGGGGGGGGGDACSTCTNETFEGTGYAVAGWSEGVNGGIVNEDYATAPAPILGSQSLLVKNVAFASSYTEINLPNATEGWMRAAIVLTNTAVSTWYVLMLADNGGAELASVIIQAGKLRIKCGTATADTGTSITANTTNYVWMHYLKGTGANAVADVGFALHPTKTRPTGGGTFAQVTTGTSTANVQLYRLGGGDITSGGAVAGAIYETVGMTTLGVIGDFP
jgi:hypothetical protein